MWHDIFYLDLPVAEKILRPILVYAFLVIALRLAGKRELSQLSSLDFVVLLAVANAVQNGIIGNDDSVTGGLIGAASLFVLNAAVAWVLFRHLRLRRLVEGKPTVLIRDGAVDEHAVRREEITMDELLEEIQSQGAAGIQEVEQAQLTPSGKVVTVLKQPTPEARRYEALTRELSELKAMVAALRPT